MRGGSRPAETRAIYLIGDDGCDKSSLFQLLQLEQEELSQQINVYVKLQPSSAALEVYEFPTDRVIRSATALYLRLLPPPVSVLYFLKEGASQRDICEWIRILNDCEVTARVVFLSDVTTYLEREKILTRLAREFQGVLGATFFIKIQPYAFRTSFEGISECGVRIERANCLKPTLPRKIAMAVERTARLLRKLWARGRDHPESVV